ncbi:survival motor neuron protein [Bradysia coprophila]|uniref:survival motor neuron protein n=1 Tax=Bradysia coprophila TaxID=38358 RepID=UPI00187DD697|nr:survival motor neuron protein [Bradysia coprophila]
MSNTVNSKSRGKNIDLSNADIWDDTLLIKAYDESLKLAKEEVAKRIARSTNKKNANDSVDDDDETASKQSQCQYSVGDFVRATYEDGLDYEAKIVSIDAECGNCVVRFIGYENEETVDLNDLLASWGKNVRKNQMRAAAKDVDKSTKRKGNFPSNVPNTSVPIPMLPPLPPMLNDTSEDSENMSAMLMSWYMSGYYTGYYQGQKEAQNKMSKK